MPMLTRKQLNQYVEAREALCEAAKAGLLPDLMSVNFSDIAFARDEISTILNGHISLNATAVSRLAAEFYDLVRELSTGETLGAKAFVSRNPAATDGFVRAEIQMVVDDPNKTESFIQSCLGRSDYELKKVAGDTVYRNGWQDPHRVLYARVPTGVDTCKFCNMLASRGAVYLTAKSAGADDPDHYHSNCRCSIVPMWDNVRDGWSRNRSISTVVEGYDPDALYDQYLKDIDDGSLKRTKLAKAAEEAHRRNKYRYVR